MAAKATVKRVTIIMMATTAARGMGRSMKEAEDVKRAEANAAAARVKLEMMPALAVQFHFPQEYLPALILGQVAGTAEEPSTDTGRLGLGQQLDLGQFQLALDDGADIILDVLDHVGHAGLISHSPLLRTRWCGQPNRFRSAGALTAG